MIVEKMVPEIYYKESRDFAYMGRVLEILCNYMKTAADNVGVEPNDHINANIISLLVNTLGFETKHEYQTKDLVYVASAFLTMIKNKGSMYAIELALKTLLNSQKISTDLIDISRFYHYNNETKELTIFVPSALTDIVLFEDLLDYILPAGILCKIVRVSAIIDSDITKTVAYLNQFITYSDDSFTSRIHDIYPASENTDPHIGTIYTGTTIDNSNNFPSNS